MHKAVNAKRPVMPKCLRQGSFRFKNYHFDRKPQNLNGTILWCIDFFRNKIGQNVFQRTQAGPKEGNPLDSSTCSGMTKNISVWESKPLILVSSPSNFALTLTLSTKPSRQYFLAIYSLNTRTVELERRFLYAKYFSGLYLFQAETVEKNKRRYERHNTKKRPQREKKTCSTIKLKKRQTRDSYNTYFSQHCTN